MSGAAPHRRHAEHHPAARASRARFATRCRCRATPAPTCTIIPGATQAAANQDVGGNMGENRQQFTVHGSRDQRLPAAARRPVLRHDGGRRQLHVERQPDDGRGGQRPHRRRPDRRERERRRADQRHRPRRRQRVQRLVPGNFGTKDLQANNLDDELRARGATTSPFIKTSYELAGGVGGPIKRDKLWFFGSARRWVSQSYQPGNYFNATQGTLFYTPDLDRPAYEDNFYNEIDGAPDVAGGADATRSPACSATSTTATATSASRPARWRPKPTGDDLYEPNWRTQVAWTFPVDQPSCCSKPAARWSRG